MLACWGWRLVRALHRYLPESVCRLLAAWATWLGFFFLPAKRATIRRNMRVVLADTPDGGGRRIAWRARALAWRQMAGYGHVVLDFVTLPSLVQKVRADTVDTPGWQYVDAELAAGRGVVFATAHFGSWDAAGAALAAHCGPGKVFAIAEPFANPHLDALITRERAGYGLGAIPMHDPRRMVRTLREGNILGVLVDRPVTSGDGVPVKLFGRQTLLPAGAAALATMARCSILPGYLRRRPDGGFEGEVLPPITPIRTGNREADLAATMQLVVNSLETVIRQAPEQWYMFRDMWAAPEAERGVPVRRTLPRLSRWAVPAARYGSVAVAAWYASRLPVVRSALKAFA